MTDRIAMLTTVANFDLYSRTAPHFPKGIEKYIIDGRNGMHGIHSMQYMMKKLRGRNIDWLIMADEDVIFTKPKIVFNIIEKMKTENYSLCGIRDGGMIPHRKYNPFAINTFFSILNFKEVEQLWDKNEIIRNQYIHKDEFKDDLLELNYPYNPLSLYEPYYGFYFWLRRNGKKILFLKAEMHTDGITNSIIFENESIAHHTWYARSYGNNQKHTKRIDAILDSFVPNYYIEAMEPPIIFKKYSFALEQMMKKYFKRFKNKIGL